MSDGKLLGCLHPVSTRELSHHTTAFWANRWLKDPPVPLFHNGKQIPLVELPKAEDLLRTREPFLPPIPPPAEQADRREITDEQVLVRNGGLC